MHLVLLVTFVKPMQGTQLTNNCLGTTPCEIHWAPCPAAMVGAEIIHVQLTMLRSGDIERYQSSLLGFASKLA